jgi:hypothetical protein
MAVDRFERREVHPLVPAVLLGMAWQDPLNLKPEPQPGRRYLETAELRDGAKTSMIDR